MIISFVCYSEVAKYKFMEYSSNYYMLKILTKKIMEINLSKNTFRKSSFSFLLKRKSFRNQAK